MRSHRMEGIIVSDGQTWHQITKHEKWLFPFQCSAVGRALSRQSDPSAQLCDLSGLQSPISAARSTARLSQRTLPAVNNDRQDSAFSDLIISVLWQGGETALL